MSDKTTDNFNSDLKVFENSNIRRLNVIVLEYKSKNVFLSPIIDIQSLRTIIFNVRRFDKAEQKGIKRRLKT